MRRDKKLDIMTTSGSFEFLLKDCYGKLSFHQKLIYKRYLLCLKNIESIEKSIDNYDKVYSEYITYLISSYFVRFITQTNVKKDLDLVFEKMKDEMERITNIIISLRKYKRYPNNVDIEYAERILCDYIEEDALNKQLLIFSRYDNPSIMYVYQENDNELPENVVLFGSKREKTKNKVNSLKKSQTSNVIEFPTQKKN